MALRVLIVPDKFKGTLTAAEAAESIASGWRKERPKDVLTLLPMSDGGDGFGTVTGQLLKARKRQVATLDAAHQPCRCAWWLSSKGIAVVESASAIGLAMLPKGTFHPFQLDTFGLGRVLAEVARSGAQHCLVGVGGSATNDGGFGLARSLGWEFLNRRGERITEWPELTRLWRITKPEASLGIERLTVVADVTNPLLGPKGASRVYGPQKGLRPQDIPVAEKCLARLAKVAANELGRDYARLSGSGAAGGLSFGLRAFLGATLEPGFDAFSDLAGLSKRLDRADLVITGEGKVDSSSLMGKGVGSLAELCKEKGIPCVCLGGAIDPGVKGVPLFHRVKGLLDLTTEKKALAQPRRWLERLSREIGRGLEL